MGASQPRAHPPSTPLLPAPPPPLSRPPTHADITAPLATAITPPPLPANLAAYLDWLFSLPPYAAPQFALYLLHLTQSTLLPTTPPPPLADLIATPPASLYPARLARAAAAVLPTGVDGVDGEDGVDGMDGMVYCGVRSEEVGLMVLWVLGSRQRMAVCFRMMRDGPLLAACRIAQALLAALSLPLTAHLTPSNPYPAPLQLLRSHQLRHTLSPLLARIDWALSPAAVRDEGSDTAGSETAYWMYGVSVVQLTRLRSDVLRLLELMCEERGWVRAQRCAVLLGVWRGQHGGSGRGGAGGSLGLLAGDPMFDVHLLREMFGYVWE